MDLSVFIGWDPREELAWQIARDSLLHHASTHVQVHQLCLAPLVSAGLYRRPTRVLANGTIIDELSQREDYDGRISTEHAVARFFVPHLSKTRWAVFMDGDVMLRGDVAELSSLLDPSKAVMCVKHWHEPSGDVKKGGDLQTRYARKNWSSVVAFNCEHEGNSRLTLDLLNSESGRDLHAFCWLRDDEIGVLPPTWNWLVGWNHGQAHPRLVHFTEGVPSVPGYESCEYADEWFAWARRLGWQQAAE